MKKFNYSFINPFWVFFCVKRILVKLIKFSNWIYWDIFTIEIVLLNKIYNSW